MYIHEKAISFRGALFPDPLTRGYAPGPHSGIHPRLHYRGPLDYSTPLVSRSASPVCGLEERLSPTTLNKPIISTSETREVETGVVASAPWPDPRISCSVAGSHAPRPVMVREAKFATLCIFFVWCCRLQLSEKEQIRQNWKARYREMYQQLIGQARKGNLLSHPKRPPRPYDYSKEDRYTTGMLFIPKKQMVSQSFRRLLPEYLAEWTFHKCVRVQQVYVQQVARVIWRRPHRIRGGCQDSCLTQCFLELQVSHHMQDLELFSRVRTVKPRGGQTDRRPGPWIAIACISCIRCGLTIRITVMQS